LNQQTVGSTMLCNTTFILDGASTHKDVPAMIETSESDSSTVGVEDDEEEEDEKESLEGVGALLQDLFNSDDAKAYAITLDALNQDLAKDKKKIQTVGGCFVLVHLLKNCLDKAIARIPACDQVTKLNEFAELPTLHYTLCVITRLTFQHDASRVGISAIGGVEALVKIMQTFPKCQRLQASACGALRNLTWRNITGKKKAIEAGGIDVLLASVSNHLGSAILCQNACRGLESMASGSKENIERLISLGAAAAVVKVKNKWPNHKDVQIRVRKLAKLIAAEMNSWADGK
jgi:hypothetical protein